ncbi:MAG: cytochrome c oxidase assembly factor Coa1 family protein [Bacteroidota bacterium]
MLIGISNDNFNRFGSAHVNQHLYEEAFQLSVQNERVQELLGDNITKMSMIFGEVTLNEDETEMQLVITMGGDKSKGKLLIWAHKSGEVWESNTIKVRKTISPIETVTILE